MSNQIRVIEIEHYWLCKGRSIHGRLMIPREKVWTFNGDFERPSFQPSIHETWNKPGQNEGDPDIPQCNHYVITDGTVNYCPDCTHELAGQTLELEPWTEAEIQEAMQ